MAPPQSNLFGFLKKKAQEQYHGKRHLQDKAFEKAIQFGKDWFLDPKKSSEYLAAVEKRNKEYEEVLKKWDLPTELSATPSMPLKREVPLEFEGQIMRPKVLEKINNLAKESGWNVFRGPDDQIGEELLFSENRLASALSPNDPDLKGLDKRTIEEIIAGTKHRVGVNLGSGLAVTHRGEFVDKGLRKVYREFDPEEVAATGAHELGHTAQKIEEWGAATTKYDPEYGYHVPNTDTEIGKRFAEAMVEPKKLTVADKAAGRPYNHQTWLSSPNELHSELMAVRHHAYRDFVDERGMDPEYILEFLRNPTDELVDVFLNQGDLNRFFKSTTPVKERRELIRLLPVLLPAAGVAGASTLTQEQDGGYIELELSDDEIQQYRDGGYIVEDIPKYQIQGEVAQTLYNTSRQLSNPMYQQYLQEVALPVHQENVQKGQKALDIMMDIEERYPGEATKGWSEYGVKNFEDIGCDPSNMACIATAAKAFSAADKANFGDLTWDQISNYRLEKARKEGSIAEKWPGFKLGYTGTGPEAREAAYAYAAETPYASIISATGRKTSDHGVLAGHSPSGESWIAQSPSYEGAIGSGPATEWSTWHGGDPEADYKVDPSTRFNVITYQPERISQSDIDEWTPLVEYWNQPSAELPPRPAQPIRGVSPEVRRVMKRGGYKW
jgi:hypothetical protein